MVTFLVTVAVVAGLGVGAYAFYSKKSTPPAPRETDLGKYGTTYEHGGRPEAPKPAAGPPKMKYNPLRLTKGSKMEVNDGDLAGIVFVVDKVESYNEVIDGGSYPFTDYLILSQTIQKDHGMADANGRIYLRLRVIRPEDDVDGGTPESLVYWVQETHPHSKEWIQKNIFDSKGILTLAEVMPDEPEASFTCIDKSPEPHEVERTLYRDDNGDGVLSEDEATVAKVEYWAFERTVSYEGEEYPQYAVVQVNQNTGSIDVLVGYGVAPSCIRIS